MMIGTYYLSIFAGSTISGRLGALYERLSSAQFWLIHAAIVTAGGLLILSVYLATASRADAMYGLNLNTDCSRHLIVSFVDESPRPSTVRSSPNSAILTLSRLRRTSATGRFYLT